MPSRMPKILALRDCGAALVIRSTTQPSAPGTRIDATGVDPRINRRDAGEDAVNGDFSLSKTRARTRFELIREIVRNAQIPKLVAVLSLRDDIEKNTPDIGRQREVDRRAHPHGRFGPDPAAVAIDDPVDRREPDPRAGKLVFAVQAAWRWLACYEIWRATAASSRCA